MTDTAIQLDQVGALLANNGYSVAPEGNNVVKISEVDSGVSIRAVLEGNILFFTLSCIVVPDSALRPEVLRKMLASDNGISTSHFQLYNTEPGKVAVTLNNFCTLQDMGSEDEDDILSSVHYLLVDVMTARNMLGNLKA